MGQECSGLKGSQSEHNCFTGRVMSPHRSDQMSQMSQVSRVALYMSTVKVT